MQHSKNSKDFSSVVDISLLCLTFFVVYSNPVFLRFLKAVNVSNLFQYLLNFLLSFPETTDFLFNLWPRQHLR